MRELFGQRRHLFVSRCLRYLRYVANDHAVLVFLVLFGGLLWQYQNLLQHPPVQSVWLYLLIGVVTVVLFVSGRLAIYLEEADHYFLLTKEEAVRSYLVTVVPRAFGVWGGVQLLGQLLLVPLYSRLGCPFWLIGLFLLLLSIGKWFFFAYQLSNYLRDDQLDWDRLIHSEIARKQRILQFYALFTQVKGVSIAIRRRSYLDVFLRMVIKKQRFTWDYLYLRAFLRSGDFFGISCRLGVLSLVCLLTVSESWLAVGLACLLDYLLVFQLVGLYGHYDRQYMTRLYPLSLSDKRSGLVRVIRRVVFPGLIFQSLLSLIVLDDKLFVLLFVGFALFVLGVDIPQKVKKLIDE